MEPMEPLDTYQNKRYFLEVQTQSKVDLHVVEKKDLSKWLSEHSNAKCIDRDEYERLRQTA